MLNYTGPGMCQTQTKKKNVGRIGYGRKRPAKALVAHILGVTEVYIASGKIHSLHLVTGLAGLKKVLETDPEPNV